MFRCCQAPGSAAGCGKYAADCMKKRLGGMDILREMWPDEVAGRQVGCNTVRQTSRQTGCKAVG